MQARIREYHQSTYLNPIHFHSIAGKSNAALGMDLLQGPSPHPIATDIQLSILVASLKLPLNPTVKFSVSEWITGMSASNAATSTYLLTSKKSLTFLQAY